MNRRIFIDQADERRELAQRRRHKGQHTGKAARGWNWQRPDCEAGSIERAYQESIARLRARTDLLVLAFAQAVDGDDSLLASIRNDDGEPTHEIPF
jgi:hypothetical protein